MDAMTSGKSESDCTGTFDFFFFFFSLGVEKEVHLLAHCFEIFSFSLRKKKNLLNIIHYIRILKKDSQGILLLNNSPYFDETLSMYI